MKMFKLYADDLGVPNLRDNGEETTEEVVSRWFDEDVYYETEYPSACDDSKAVDQYYNITAERILLRKKVLGLCNDDGIARSEKLLASHPFLGSDLTLGTLFSPDVNVAMALVPLTPLDEQSDRDPELARLYCIKGVPGQNDIPFESEFPSGADRFVWFLCGCDKTAKPSGESWHLAAHLLMRVVEDAHRKKNLVTHFVVTGRVQSAEIRPVEMGRKSELADVWEFKDLRWIMHEDNKMNMNNAMRKVETPKTLDEALELIGTLQNKATRSFFRFLSSGNLDGMKEQYEIGADIFACEESTGQMPMEILGELIEKEAKKSSDTEQKLHLNGKTRLMRLKEMMTWLKAQGADCALMFYMLAKYGLDDALQSCLKIWPVEARTANGLNATELALESGDYDTACKLRSLGCKCRPQLPNSFLSSAVNLYFGADMKARQTVETALSVGLSPCCEYVVDNGYDDMGHSVHGYKTSLFGAALYNGDYNLVEKCLDAGADPNSTIKIYRWHEDEQEAYLNGIVYWEREGYYCQASDSGSPLYIVNCLWAMRTLDNVHEVQDKISTLLMSRGAKKDVRVAHCQYRHEVVGFLSHGDSECKRRVLKFIGEGQPIDIKVPVKYASADDVPKTETLTTTLWGAAVYNGDVELMRECLEHGASVSKKLQFAHAGKDKVVDLQYLNGRTPYEVIMTSEDIPLENQMLAIQMLKKYGLKNEDCPKDLEVIRHTEELSLLKTSCDPYVQRRIGIGNHMVANTTVWGMAVYWGWADVIERCLELGAPARKELKYWDGDCVYDEPWEEPHLLDNGTPKELILKNKDIAPWEKNRIVKLLRKYANE